MIGIAGSVAWVFRLRLKQNTGVHGQRCAAQAARAEPSPAPARGLLHRPKWNRYWYLPVFAIYLTIVVVTVAEHEPSTRRGPSLAYCPRRGLARPVRHRFRGMKDRPSSGIWFWRMPARCGLPYASLGVLAAAFAGGGVLLFLARSPLPKFLAAIVPFTFFLIYQNAVVARSYALMPLLLFAAAAAHSGRHRRPMLYVAPLGLLTHVSAHGWLIGASLVGLLSLEILYRGWRGREQLPLRRAATCRGLVRIGGAGSGLADAAGGGPRKGPRLRVSSLAADPVRHRAPERSVYRRLRSVAGGPHRIAGLVLAYASAGRLRPADGRHPGIFVTANCWYHHEQVLFLIWLFALWISFRRARRAGGPGIAAGSMVPTMLGRPAGGRVRHSNLLGLGERSRGSAGGVFGREGLGRIPQARRARFPTDRVQRRVRCRGPALFRPEYFRQPSEWPRLLVHHLVREVCASANLWTPTPYREPFDVLVVGVKQSPFCLLPWQDPAFQLPLSSEYRCVGYFPGSQFWKTGAYERDDFVCYVRKSIPAAPGMIRAIGGPTVRIAREERRNPGDGKRSRKGPRFAHQGAGGRAQRFGMMLRLLDRRTAVEHFRAAVNLWPTRAIGHANLGAILERTDPQEAARHLRTALELDPQNVAAHINLGNILAHSGKLDAAITCYRNALAIEPDFVEARHNLRTWPWHSGNNAACRPEAATAVEPRPEARIRASCRFLECRADGSAWRRLTRGVVDPGGRLADCGGCSR